MDTIHITISLDRIRAEMSEHAKALQRIEWRQGRIMRELKRQKRQSSQPETWREYFKPIVQWVAGLLTAAYVLSGGDIMTALNQLQAVSFVMGGR